MMFEKLVDFFLPPWVRNNKTHPQYHLLRVIVSSAIIGEPLMLLFPIFLYYLGKPVTGFLVNDAMIVLLVLSIKFFGHYRVPMAITSLVTYFIIYDWIKNSGLIYSVNNSVLHMYLLVAIWAD